jgi:hypothetical protein
MATQLSVWSCVRSRGRNFETTRCISNFVVRMSWHDPIDMLHSSAISRIVKRRLEHEVFNVSVAIWLWGPSQTRHIMCCLPTILKSLKPFVTTGTAHTLITMNVFHNFICLHKRFSLAWRKIMLIRCSWISAIPNNARHTLHARKQIAVGWWLIAAGWHSKKNDN